MKALGVKIGLVSLILILSASSMPSLPRVLFLGDSVTATQDGYAEILRRELANQAIVINAGVPSCSAPDAVKRWDEFVVMNPSVVVIYFGTVDAKRIHRGLETWGDYETAIGELATLAPRAILVTPHHGLETPRESYFLSDINMAASIVRTLRYPIADVHAVCCTPDQLKDYAHPNPHGHRVIADTILPMILPSSSS